MEQSMILTYFYDMNQRISAKSYFQNFSWLVDSNFKFTSYAWLCALALLHRLLC